MTTDNSILFVDTRNREIEDGFNWIYRSLCSLNEIYAGFYPLEFRILIFYSNFQIDSNGFKF